MASSNISKKDRPVKSAHRRVRVTSSHRKVITGRRILAALLLMMIVAGTAQLPSAWQESQRREAYLPQLQTLAQQNPYDGRLLALLGGRLMEAGDFVAAADTLEHAAAVGEKTEPVWLCLAASKAAIGDPKAIGYLRFGAKTSNTPGLEAAQERCRVLGANPPPTALAQAICPQGPKPIVDEYAQGSFLNGLVEWWGRRHPEASGFTTRKDWALQQPNNAQAQRLWGLALMRNRRPAEAAVALQRAVVLAPHSPAAHLALAQILESQASPAQASLEYIATLRLHHDWLPALLGLGRTARAGQLPMAAADVYTAATRVAPQSADAWAGLGQSNVAADQNYDVALKAFRTATRLAPGRTDFVNDYAIALRHNNQWDEAEKMLRRHLAAAPADAFSHFLLAGLLLDNRPTPERLTEAQAQTSEALRLAPTSSAAQLQMAVLLLRQNKPQESIVLLQQLLTQEPANANALLTLSRAYRKAGMAAQADTTSRKAAALSRALEQIDVLNSRAAKSPSDSGLHSQLAALYAHTGQTDQAQQEKQVADLLRTNPNLQGKGTQTLTVLIADVLSGR